MNKQTTQEFATLKERLFKAEQKLSEFSDMLHEESQSNISDLDEMVVDLQYENIINELEV